MDINGIVKDFFFDGCVIRNLIIQNDLISLTGGEAMQLGIGVEPEYRGISNEKHHGIVTLQISIDANKGEEDPKASLRITIEGAFSANLSFSEERFMQLTAINGAAALYSVARGKIDAVTGTVFKNGKIDIPFINFIEFYRSQEKKE